MKTQKEINRTLDVNDKVIVFCEDGWIIDEIEALYNKGQFNEIFYFKEWNKSFAQRHQIYEYLFSREQQMIDMDISYKDYTKG